MFENKIVGDWAEFDVGLIQLVIPVRLTSNVGIVCLPPDEENKFEGEALTGSGWGKTKVSEGKYCEK